MVVLNDSLFYTAARIASEKSLCARDRCGAVVVCDGKVIGRGYNAPPGDNLAYAKCALDFPVQNRKKPKSDCTCCVHAEIRAIEDAQRRNRGRIPPNSVLYFIRLGKGTQISHAIEPYCTMCSRAALDAGIAYWALLHKDGSKLYDAKTYNDISYDFHMSVKSIKGAVL